MRSLEGAHEAVGMKGREGQQRSQAEGRDRVYTDTDGEEVLGGDDVSHAAQQALAWNSARPALVSTEKVVEKLRGQA
jgi:hypothetical protein